MSSNPFQNPISDYVTGRLIAEDQKKRQQTAPGPSGGYDAFHAATNIGTILNQLAATTGLSGEQIMRLVQGNATDAEMQQALQGGAASFQDLIAGTPGFFPGGQPGSAGGNAPGGPQLPSSSYSQPGAQEFPGGGGGSTTPPPASVQGNAPSGPQPSYGGTAVSDYVGSETGEPSTAETTEPTADTEPSGGGGAPSPVIDTSGNAPDTGWSSTLAPEMWGDLAANPIQAERVLLQQQGLDPNSTNPLIQARLREAARARGLFQLLYGAGGQVAGFEPGNFLDWFQGYMQNQQTPGAAPTVTASQAIKLLNQALQSGTDPNNPWAKMLLNISDVDPATAIGYAPSPGDQSDALNQLLLSVLGGVVDPAYLKALTENTQRAEQNWRTNIYDVNAGQAPDLGFLDYYLKNNPLAGIAGNG